MFGNWPFHVLLFFARHILELLVKVPVFVCMSVSRVNIHAANIYFIESAFERNNIWL